MCKHEEMADRGRVEVAGNRNSRGGGQQRTSPTSLLCLPSKRIVANRYQRSSGKHLDGHRNGNALALCDQEVSLQQDKSRRIEEALHR